MSGTTLGPRQHELEQIFSRLHEPAATIEGRRPPIGARDNDLQRESALRDGESLRELEQLAPDALRLVLGADEELVDADGVARTLERDVAGRVALELRDEDGLPLEHGERAVIGPAIEARKPEEQRLVAGLVGSNVGLPVRHPDCAIARSTASCSSGDRATGALPRSSCLT